MVGMLIPEYVIANTLRSIVDLLRKDLREKGSDKETLLYKLYSVDENGEKLVWNFAKFYIQMKSMILNEDNLSINWGYNPKVANNLALHILLPSESATMAIGADEGYQEEIEVDENGKVTSIQNYFTQTFDSTYQIMITGVNSSEVTYMYHILKSMLLMLVPQLELAGLRTPSFSGNDIVMQDDLTPVPIFHKVLNISCKYEHNVPKLVAEEVAKRIYFELHPIDYENKQ